MYLLPIKTCSQNHLFLYLQNETFNNGILFNGVLIAELLKNYFASCLFKKFGFLIPHRAHFGCIINLPFFVLEIFESKFSEFFFTLYMLN